MRENEPVFWSPQLQAWLITSYADVVAALRSPKLSANRILPRMYQLSDEMRQEFAPLARGLTMWPLLQDPPYHARLRTILSTALSRELVHSFRAAIQRLVVELLDKVHSTGEMDMVRDFAYPLPLFVVSEIIGVPEEHRELMKRCAIDIVTFFGTSPDNYVRHARVAMKSVQDANDCLLALLNERRKHPRADLLTGLTEAADRGTVHNEEELLALCIMLVFAAFETTTNLLGNGILTLLRNPDQLQTLRARPELMKSAIDEMLRFETPVQRLSRMVVEDHEIHGRALKKGDLVFLIAGAANRDPAHFVAPDSFDCTRGDNSHLGFGFYIHTCPGSTLARLEASIAFKEILERMPNLRLASDKADWMENLSVRALKTLPLKFSS